MNPRPDIAKCPGADKPFCEQCLRKLAPEGQGQRWIQPMFNLKDECISFMPTDTLGYLYGGADEAAD
jgi:hypothetical protein